MFMSNFNTCIPLFYFQSKDNVLMHFSGRNYPCLYIENWFFLQDVICTIIVHNGVNFRAWIAIVFIVEITLP